jgi:hypothetical protein
LNRKLVCGIAAAICSAAGVAGVVVNRYAESVCVATNAAGQQVVIGTELTPAGQRYKQENPGDNNNAILEALGGRGPEAAWTASSIARCRTMRGISGVLWAPLLGLALLFCGAAVFTPRGIPQRPGARQVFLSYNHEDAEVAARLQQHLKAHGIPVLIDSESITPGERIQDFIARSIEKSEVVVSLVSSRSLLSAWVAMETIQTLQRNKWVGKRTFVACYLDETFLAPEARLRLTEQIDDRLRRIEELLPDYAARRLDSVDLNEEKTRLYDLRNNLGLILATLKDSVCLDVRDGAFDASAKRLVAAIHAEKA